MSLNDISLPASVVSDLYSSSLVQTGEIAAKQEAPVAIKEPVVVPGSKKGLKWLGDNEKNILIVVNSSESVYLPDNELQFLTNMLTACKLSLADVAIVNINQQTVSYKELLQELKSRIALLFDIEPAGFGLPMSFPHFQIQPFAGCSFLYSPSLNELENDKVMKSKLWVSLRRLFNI
ncbi:MAG TPA: hypothetical protein VF476_02740 [Chitinophagaceae bacterium]